MEGILLERIARLNGFFISDLRSKSSQSAILKMLRRVDWRGYPLPECSYCLSYILGASLAFASYEELEEYLQQMD